MRAFIDFDDTSAVIDKRPMYFIFEEKHNLRESDRGRLMYLQAGDDFENQLKSCFDVLI